MSKQYRNKKVAHDYRHEDAAIMRPESGAQENFPDSKRKPPKEYRYDSSLAPEMAWDETAARREGEQWLEAILNAENLEDAKAAAEKLQALSAAFLNWAGKAERGRFSVPTLPLFVHERLSTQAVLETLKRRHPQRGITLELFGEGNKSIGDKIRGAYEHLNGWQNRLILGDSLQVMNSLLEYENFGRQIQMVYMDPPYGIKFGGNFQPFVRKREVKDGDDESLSREPEMVKAFRDTWTLGVHSWLTYMRDRLLLAREMLTDSGSCFVQISDENVHLVRCVMDEVFGRENFVTMICYQTRGVLGSRDIVNLYDLLIWYAKDKKVMKFREVFTLKTEEFKDNYPYVFKNGKLEKAEDSTPLNIRVSLDDLNSSGLTPSCVYEYEFQGKTYKPRLKKSWRTNINGMKSLEKKNRLAARGNLYFLSLFSDFPVSRLTNIWKDIGSASGKSYVVETNEKVIQRCMLMTTDPGDLVFDPTCGSGTTAVVAEQWGRRWITTDVSRVPLVLTRQRLLTATYPYYQLKDPQRGPASGFVYERKKNKKGEEVGGIVPHITLKSIANNEPPAEEVLVDKPETTSNVVRISGPFCVEAILPTPVSPESEAENIDEPAEQYNVEHIPRMLRVLQLSPEIKLPGGKTFGLTKVRAPAKSLNLHAEAETADNVANGERIAIVFGPENGAISDGAVIEAGSEAKHKGYARLLVIAFAIEPDARKTIEQAEATFGIPAIYAQASTDLVMSDLLKNTRASQIFAVVGLPDITLTKLPETDDSGADLYQVTLNGLDTFDPVTMEQTSLDGGDVPCWMLDTDYDNQVFRAGQVFFPRTAAWDKLRTTIRADFSDEVWDRLRGNTSAPFVAGRQIAVKALDERGNELLVVRRVDEVK